jgi:hypothetical protein
MVSRHSFTPASSVVRYTITVLAVLLVTAMPADCAAEVAKSAMDTAELRVLEHQAEQASPRDQCYLYTQVLHGLTELAGRQIADGDDEAANRTLLKADLIATKVEYASTANAKRLKDTEQLLAQTTRRLTDIIRIASSPDRSSMLTTLRHLDRIHTNILALVFMR